LISCNSPEKKVSNAEELVKDADRNLAEARQEYKTDMENYRKEMAHKIADNTESLTRFKARIENEKEADKIRYNKEIADLEKKNTDMQKRIEDYNDGGKENWEKFRIQFDRDMEELSRSSKQITVTKNK
jgi:exonuclease VII large subunit